MYWEGGYDITESSCNVRGRFKGPCLEGGDTRVHFCGLEGYARAHSLGSVGDLLAHVQERGDPKSNVEGERPRTHESVWF